MTKKQNCTSLADAGVKSLKWSEYTETVRAMPQNYLTADLTRIDASLWGAENELGQLFAAAPELLASLIEMTGGTAIEGGVCQYCGRDYIGDDDIDVSEPTCPSDDCPHTMARAAIAKATGKAVQS